MEDNKEDECNRKEYIMINSGIDFPDDSNIPINCFLEKREDGTYRWTASNFMPRKECVLEDGYDLLGTKEEIEEYIKKYVIPLYKTAIKNLQETSELYYWKK